MGDKTAIGWTDATWNPVTGCDKVSPGCDNCYAECIAHRFAGTKAYPDGFKVTLRPERLQQPLKWTRPRMVFVNSMSDLFHAQIPTDYIAQVFAVMSLGKSHTFQVLTKRPARMRALLSDPKFVVLVDDHRGGPAGDFTWPLPNVWVGVSAENQKWWDLRVPILQETQAAVRFVSAEPLLGPIEPAVSDSDLDWVIVGGESGARARRMRTEWATGLRDFCRDSEMAFFFKQWGTYCPADQLDPDTRARLQAAGTLTEWNRGGRWFAKDLLDGVAHEEFPSAAH